MRKYTPIARLYARIAANDSDDVATMRIICGHIPERNRSAAASVANIFARKTRWRNTNEMITSREKERSREVFLTDSMQNIVFVWYARSREGKERKKSVGEDSWWW